MRKCKFLLKTKNIITIHTCNHSNTSDECILSMQNDFILTITNEGNSLTIEKNNRYTVIYKNNTEWNHSVCLLLVKYPALLPHMDSLFRSYLVYLSIQH